MVEKGERSWKLIGTVLAVGAGIAMKKALGFGWERATGHVPPSNPEDPEVTWQEALAWALASGAAIGVARMLMARQTANYWKRSTGKLPPGLREVG